MLDAVYATIGDTPDSDSIASLELRLGDISTLVDSSPDLVTEVNTKPSLTTVTSMLDAVYATIGDTPDSDSIASLELRLGDVSTLVDSSPDLVTEVNTKPNLTTVTSMLDAVYAAIVDATSVPTVDVDAVNQVLTSSGAIDIRDPSIYNTVDLCTNLFNGSPTANCGLEVAKTIGRTLPMASKADPDTPFYIKVSTGVSGTVLDIAFEIQTLQGGSWAEVAVEILPGAVGLTEVGGRLRVTSNTYNTGNFQFVDNTADIYGVRVYAYEVSNNDPTVGIFQLSMKLVDASLVKWSAFNSIASLEGRLGDLSTLTTTDKSSAIAAINDVNAKVEALEAILMTLV